MADQVDQAEEAVLARAVGPLQRQPPGQHLGHLHAGEKVLLAVGVRSSTPSDGERFEMNGNGCPGSTASGVSTGEDVGVEIAVGGRPLGLGQVLPAQQVDAVRRQGRADRRP